MRTMSWMAACALFTAGAAAAQTTTGSTTKSGSSSSSTGISTSQAPAFGPRGILLGVDGELALPVGNFADVTGFGIGAYLTGEYAMNPNLSLTGRAGLQLHLSKDLGGGASSSVQALPILAGVKYYLQGTDRQGPFALGEVGFNIFYHHFDFGPTLGSDTGLDLDIDLGAGVGYQLGALNFKLMMHSMNIAHFGNTLMLTLGGGVAFQGM